MTLKLDVVCLAYYTILYTRLCVCICTHDVIMPDARARPGFVLLICAALSRALFFLLYIYQAQARERADASLPRLRSVSPRESDIYIYIVIYRYTYIYLQHNISHRERSEQNARARGPRDIYAGVYNLWPLSLLRAL